MLLERRYVRCEEGSGFVSIYFASRAVDVLGRRIEHVRSRPSEVVPERMLISVSLSSRRGSPRRERWKKVLSQNCEPEIRSTARVFYEWSVSFLKVSQARALHALSVDVPDLIRPNVEPFCLLSLLSSPPTTLGRLFSRLTWDGSLGGSLRFSGQRPASKQRRDYPFSRSPLPTPPFAALPPTQPRAIAPDEIRSGPRQGPP